jgi:CheY-like chemotaxis protein
MNESILIIEDDALNLKLARITLDLAGFAVRTATNAEEGLRALSFHVPKLILLDIKLPDRDGMSLARQLKADPQFKHVSIVAITACAMKGDKEKILAAGCDAYVAKPVEPEQLVEIIRARLRIMGQVDVALTTEFS